MKHYDVAIVGAGTAGLSARREVAKVTQSYVVIDPGALGTTCARVGCMPSKVLIQVANDFHRRHSLAEMGISGGEDLRVDRAAAMRHVRKLRDRFVRAVVGDMASWTDTHLIRKWATLADVHTLELHGEGGVERIHADRIIFATGSSPITPAAWRPFQRRLIDTDSFFELEALPERVAVVGLGVVGLELGQALSRLGVDVVGITLDKAYGGLTDPEIQDYAHRKLSEELPIHLSPVSALAEDADGLTLTLADGTRLTVDAALVTMGRRPNVTGLGLERFGVPMERGVPIVDEETYRIPGTPWFLVGDVNGERPILHETSDEGRIAGYHAVHDDDARFGRRAALTIAFTDPQIALVGERHSALKGREADFVTGRVTYEGQGRAIVKLKEKGLVHVYADRATGRFLGAELFAPQAEHLAHLLAWALATEQTVHQMLGMPFYHPVLEEGLRTALRHAARQLDGAAPPLEIPLTHPPRAARAPKAA